MKTSSNHERKDIMSDNLEPKDDFMNASAEEWSKEEVPQPPQPTEAPETDRWGAHIPSASDDDPSRWGAEPLEQAETPKLSDVFPKSYNLEKKSKFPWWILIVVLVVMCLCVVGIIAAIASGIIAFASGI